MHSELESRIWSRLAEIPDPEVPVISITELGVVRKIDWNGERLHRMPGYVAFCRRNTGRHETNGF